MLKKTIAILEYISSRTDEVILFHSVTGKDSIALLDLTSKYFKRVVCVFMYGVKDFEHVGKYMNWAKRKYNVEFIQLPHFCNYTYIKAGYMGIKQDKTIKTYNLSNITDIARKKTGIDWVIFGMKQSDGLNRRIMLRGYYLNAVNEKSRKAYPLSEWSNKDVIAYIELNNLIRPIKYNSDRSQGFEPSNINYLLFLKNNYPNDLKKLISVFPMAQQLLFEHEYHNKANEN